MKKVLSKEEQLAELAQELYQNYDRVVIPLYPRVFIRVLPREQQVGSIILPDHQQNKTQWEGVVLATYAPAWRKGFVSTDKKKNSDHLYDETYPERRAVDSHYVVCDVKPGDHILFPYHVGLPDPVFDEKKYRIIREEDISCTLKYDQHIADELESKILDLGNGLSQIELKDWLLERFDLVPKNLVSRTVSGK